MQNIVKFVARNVNVSTKSQSLIVRRVVKLHHEPVFVMLPLFYWLYIITRLRGKLGKNSSLGKSHKAISYHNVPISRVTLNL